MEAIDRTVLYNLDAEDVVLGSIFMEPELIKECDLKAEEFSPGLNIKMYKTFLDLDKKDIPIEPVSVAHRLGKHLEQVGGIARILELVNKVPSTRNFKRHCEIVREAYQRRRIIEVLEQKKYGALEGDVSDVIKEIQKEIESIEANTTTKIDGNIKNALKELAAKVENATGEHSGIYPGFKDLQRLIYAYLKGQLIVTGARPSMGEHLPRKLAIV